MLRHWPPVLRVVAVSLTIVHPLDNAFHGVVRKAQQLFACTVPNKTEVCNFFSKADENQTDIVGNLCDKFGTFLYSSCTRAVGGARDSAETAACGSHLRESSTGVICDCSESKCFSDVSELTQWSPCDFKSWCEWCVVSRTSTSEFAQPWWTGANVALEECKGAPHQPW